MLRGVPSRRRGGAGKPVFAEHSPRMTGPRQFRFLNETRELVFPYAWNDPGVAKLWLYNLHYFEDLNAKDAPERERVAPRADRALD